MNRFKMVFNNAGYIPQQPITLASISSANSAAIAIPRNLPLSANMIDRVHKARPGCSACGKKVM